MRAFHIASHCIVAIVLAACGDTLGNPIGLAPEPAGSSGSSGGSSGSSGGSSGGTDSGTTSGGGDAGAGQDPMLVVASSLGVLAWRDAKGITTDVAPDVVIAAGSMLAVTSIADRVYLSKGEPGRVDGSLLRFDGARSLTSASAPSMTIAVSKPATRLLGSEAADSLFGVQPLGDANRWSSPATLTSGSAPAATFHHPYGQLAGIALDAPSGRLFLGQTSGAGLLAWNAAATRTGTPPFDLKVHGGAYWAMQIADHRLYAASVASPGVAIWSDPAALGGAETPIVLTTGYDPKFISDLVVRNDVLLVAARDQGKVFVYLGASAITADRAPTFTLSHPTMTRPSRLAVDAKGRLYVADEDGVVVFRDIATNPTYVTELRAGVAEPRDLTIVE